MPKSLDQLRSEIEAKLKQGGFPVEDWKVQAEQHYSDKPRPTRATRVLPNYSRGIRMVPVGFLEYRPHPYHNAPIPRCLARRSNGLQCGNFACKDAYVCPRHGGRRTGKGYKGQDHHFYIHGGETTEIRRKRSEASRVRRRLVSLSNSINDKLRE